MKLARRTVSVITASINYWKYNDCSHVEVCDDAPIFSDEVHFGVNWSAIGTVTTDEAAKFADNLRFAIRLCDTLNSLHATYAKDYNANDPLMSTHEDYVAAREEIYGYLKDGRYGMIARWLESHALPENDFFDCREND